MASVVHDTQRLMVWAGLAGLAVAVLAAVGLSIAGIGPTGLFRWSTSGFTPLPPASGALLVFAPLAGAAVIAIVVAVRPAARWSAVSNRREAELLTEQAHALPRQLVGFAVAALALLTLTVSVGMAVQDSVSGGPTILTVTRAGNSDAIAYPGPGYVFAVVIAVLGVAGAIVAAVLRVRAAPGPGIHDVAGVDRAVRSWQTGVIVLTGSVAMILGVGIMSWTVGSSYAALSRFPVVGDCRSTGPNGSMCREVGVHYAQPAFAIGVTEVVFGVVLVAVSLTIVLVIARRIRRGIPLTVVSPTDPVTT
ncbi:hypothetical protein ACX9R5_06345 [Rathayibacter sp. CAU 1779]